MLSLSSLPRFRGVVCAAALCASLGLTAGARRASAASVTFLRGDPTADGVVDGSDAVFTLSYLFLRGPAPTCLDAVDADDDGVVSIGDAVFTLLHLYRGVPLPPPIGCGVDGVADGLDCRSHAACEPIGTRGPSIHEFLASNQNDILDEDGDSSDWIEIHHDGRDPLDLEGWHLTDDPDRLTKWAFPHRVLQGGAHLLVFASGKDRREDDPERELHTNFQLDSDGEFLALVEPDGRTVACQFSPEFPRQRRDVAYGVAQEILAEKALTVGAPARYLVARDEDEVSGGDWTRKDFDDSGWTAATTAVGFSGSSTDASLLGYWSFDDAGDPGLAPDASGRGRHAELTSQLAMSGSGGGARPAYTADGAGHSGLAGDRALDFGAGANGAAARIAAAGSGAFDAAVAANAISISLWAHGGAQQPFDDSVFYASDRSDGSGTRSANAHIPWSDGTIYWDTSGCCDPSQRISRHEGDASKWRGAWTHYVFVKDGDIKQIWQDGELFHEARNDAPLTPIRSFLIGSFARGALSYAGRLDDVAVWSRALTGDEIGRLAGGVSPLVLSSLSQLVSTDVSAAMLGESGSIYLRVAFTLASLPDFDALVLRIRYDDGFVAFLDGAEIARRNAPADLTGRSVATEPRGIGASLEAEDIDVTAYRELLRAGENVLAIHGLNASLDDDDFLISPQLVFARTSPGRYLRPPTPGRVNASGVVDFVGDTTFSVDRGFFREAFEVEIASATEGAEILYTTDGSIPGPGNPVATRYSTPIPVTTTTTLRAAAFKEGLGATNVDTQTYVFPAEVARQPARPAGLPIRWSGDFPADYQVDPEVVGNTLPDHGFEEALLSIPTVSIVLDPEELFGPERGLYYHSDQKTERAASVELIYPDGREGFQIDAGIRIHGLTSRRHDFTPKHSFRINFKSAFGPRKLKFKLFEGSPVDRFDQLVLKGLSTDSWCVQDGWNLSGYPGVRRWYRERATYMREQWMKDSLRDMGQGSTRGSFVHVYLDGLYWGVYNLTERPTDSFQSEHFGGRREDYDVLHDFAEIHSGDRRAWDAMIALAASGLSSDAAYQRIQGRRPDGTLHPDYPRYLDVDGLIDYMILHIYAGADDWPNHNWWAARRRGPESDGFRFFAWDQEITHNALDIAHTSWGPRFEEVAAPNTPSYLYARLRENADFRRRFGDRVHRHLFNGGALTSEESDRRLGRRAGEIDRAIVAESARWGDSKRSRPFRREVEWLEELRWFREVYWPGLHEVALGRFRRVGLYPDVEAPRFLVNGRPQHGGPVAAGDRLTMAIPDQGPGSIRFTLDGSDPADGAGTLHDQPLVITASLRVKARRLLNSQWSALDEAVFLVE